MAKTYQVAPGLQLMVGKNANRLNFTHGTKRASIDLHAVTRHSGPIVREAVHGWAENFKPVGALPTEFAEAVAKRSEALFVAYPFCDQQFYELQDHCRLEEDHIGTAAIAYVLHVRKQEKEDGSQ